MPSFPTGKRDKRVTFLQRERDSSGRAVGEFRETFSRWCACYSKGGGQQVEAGAAVNAALYEIVVPDDRMTRTLAVTDRILWNGAQMDIIRADQPERIRQTITIMVRDERGG